MEISSEHLHYQTVGARELDFWEKVRLPPPVMCNRSQVTCHMSHFTCHVSQFFFVDKVVKLVGGGSLIHGATPSSLQIIIRIIDELNLSEHL